MELLFATHNQNKTKELQAMLPSHIQLTCLEDIGLNEEIAETADTLEGNAMIKAEFASRYSPLPCFADDTGLEVDPLNGAPGVHTARYAGKPRSADRNMKKLIRAMEGENNRKARFVTVFALLMDGKPHYFKGVCEGTICTEISGHEGFGYDPVFRPEGYDRTFAEMTQKEKSSVSHRGRAARRLVEFLKS